MANSYNSAAEYLNKMRQELASKKSAGHALLSTTSEYILPVTEASSLTDAVSATSAVIGTYDIVDNVGVCIAYLPFDLTLDDTINTGRSAADRNDGTVTGVETYVDGPLISSTHKLRKAFSFNGSSYITLANENTFDKLVTDTFSISFWVYFASNSTQVIYSKRASGSTAGIVIYLTGSDTIAFSLHDGTNANAVTTAATATINKWHFVDCTYGGGSNRNSMKININNVSVTGAAQAMTVGFSNASSPQIGADFTALQKIASGGAISQFQYWNITHTAAEITRLYSGFGISRDAAATNPAYIGFSDIT